MAWATINTQARGDLPCEALIGGDDSGVIGATDAASDLRVAQVGQFTGQRGAKGASDDDAGVSKGAEGAGADWVLAASIERMLPRGDKQRALVFGSNSWFIDTMAAQRTNVDGRESLAFPGNWELFVASINWLAGRDELIQRGVAATSVATIPNLTDPQLGALRWGLTLGLPVLVLLVGAAWRMWRG